MNGPTTDKFQRSPIANIESYWSEAPGLQLERAVAEFPSAFVFRQSAAVTV
jgi:hypothetical protein